ncbi:FabD/lysophospholipase-like protein [Zopfia rhizophila CBS 207.26]|uniref:FabD/lysophospholipase-like protein n=1 Tax=Zopfia rhizophila CBS 207.26 TaxID=1314779 RepID=A0A6A6DFK7_9PEZI|nr:FabD/lysophospholipase-like protein [Zopfia rhizophila CBS 207.26]
MRDGQRGMASTTSPYRQNSKTLSLLSLDGGGERGLSSLYILQRLMEELNREDSPWPCECFDLLGGPSTGGLITLMLGRLGMTVEKCIESYIKILPRVFEKQKHHV